MSLSKDFKFIDPSSIIIPEGRQRTSINTEDLEGSIRERGIYNPIVITKELVLVAGERRTKAAIAVGLREVPVRFDGDLSPVERQIVELEENERRQELFWKDRVRAIAKLHELYELKAQEAGEKWSIKASAEMLFYGNDYIAKVLRVYRDIDNPRIAQAPGIGAAHNILMRLDERMLGDVMSSISAATARVVQTATAPAPLPGQPAQPASVQPLPQRDPLHIIPAEDTILQGDFISWAETYEGPLFSFVHCDFPFGVDLFAGEQGGRDKWHTYDDDPNVYWQLIRAFCKNRDRFMAASAHIMFWFNIDFYEDTLKLFAELAPEIAFRPKPLIWHKSDNVGVLSDPKRGPRHIYETALIASRDDRFILKAVSDVYSAPTDKDHHPSTKPEPMLKYFFQMFVDEHSTVLDPTCGSGAALRAAEFYKAKHTLGLEVDAEHCANARTALKHFRIKARASASTAASLVGALK